MESGIYKITCIKNKRIYIGSAKNIKERWQRHLDDLRLKSHINIHLQRAFDKYRLSSFLFEIVEECEENVLLLREQFYLDTLKPYENGFNIGRHASGGDNLTFNPNRDDIIQRMTNTINYNISKMTEQERKEKWGKNGELNPNYGNRWTDEMRLDFSNKQKENVKNGLNFGYNRRGKSNTEVYGVEKAIDISKKLSNFASTRTGDKNPFFNKKHNDETKDKIRKSMTGKKPPNRIKISINNKIYDSYHDASKELNIPIVTIRWRCLSKNCKFDEYKLVG